MGAKGRGGIETVLELILGLRDGDAVFASFFFS
jgi:hypothetical protein